MSAQIVIYNDVPDGPLDSDDPGYAAWLAKLRDAKWGWRYGDADTGLVFASRDEAFDDAQSSYPTAPIG